MNRHPASAAPVANFRTIECVSEAIEVTTKVGLSLGRGRLLKVIPPII